jgi:hypothetical protein
LRTSVSVLKFVDTFSVIKPIFSLCNISYNFIYLFREKNKRKIFTYIYILLIVYTFTHICIHCFSLASPHAVRKNLFCPLFQFCWRENVRDNKRDIAFLLAWDKDSYTERFLALLPCTCVLQLKLVHHYQTSSLLPSHFFTVASAILRLLHSLLYSEHIKHFQILGFCPFPYSSCMCSPLSVWPMSNNITAFILGI